MTMSKNDQLNKLKKNTLLLNIRQGKESGNRGSVVDSMEHCIA